MAHKILLVDDSITIQKVVSLTFSGEEYKVTAFGSGTEALNRINEVNPDIILLDVIMPDIKGYQVCEKIKKNPKFKDIPILLLTGTFEAFDEKEATRVGADGYITKPFDHQIIIERVNGLLEQQKKADIEEPASLKTNVTEELEQKEIETEDQEEFIFSEDSVFEGAGFDVQDESSGFEEEIKIKKSKGRQDETVIFNNVGDVNILNVQEDEIFGFSEGQKETTVKEEYSESDQNVTVDASLDETGQAMEENEKSGSESEDSFEIQDEELSGQEIEKSKDELEFKNDEMVFEVGENPDESQDRTEKQIVYTDAQKPSESKAELVEDSITFDTEEESAEIEEEIQDEESEQPETDHSMKEDAVSEESDEEVTFDETPETKDEIEEPVFEEDAAQEIQETEHGLTQTQKENEEELEEPVFEETSAEDEINETESETGYKPEQKTEVKKEAAKPVKKSAVQISADLLFENKEELIETISQRVAELLMENLAEKILEKIELALPGKAEGLVEKIAWEVVPDLAEIHIKKEIDNIKEKSALS